MIRKKDLAFPLSFKKENGLIISSPMDGIILGYSSKKWGDAREKNLHFSTIKEVYHQPQKHTNIVVEVPSDKDFPSSFDGSLTSRSNTLLKGFFADCLPLYFYSLTGNWIALAHSGWQGSLEGIAEVMVNFLVQKGISPEEIGCVIGPYRSFFYYEIQEDFKELFLRHYPKRWIKECFSEKEEKYFFDNGIFNLFLMKDLGLKNLFFLDLDVGTHEDFFSHRRGDFARNVAFIFKEY